MALGVKVQLYAPLAPPQTSPSNLQMTATLGLLVLGTPAAEAVQIFSFPGVEVGQVQHQALA